MASKDSQQKRDLPFHSLGVGLRNQDIGKVSTFFKSVDAVFLAFFHLLEEIIGAKAVSPAQMPLCYNGNTIDLYQGGLKLIMSCAQENIYKHRHLMFTQSLLQRLQEHLSRGIKQVMTNLKKVQMENLSNSTIEKQTDDLLTTMSDHMMSVREQSGILQKVLQREQERQQQQQQQQRSRGGRERRSSVGSLSSFREGILGMGAGPGGGAGGGAWSIDGGVTDEQRDRLITWDSLDERAVIAEGILIGELPFLQKYLTQRFGPDTAEWMNIINTGLCETLIFLQEKEMVYAKKMLQNMGFDPRTKLRSICLYTPERGLRDYLASELHSLSALTEEELEMLRFLHRLEELYSCPSFKLCRMLRTEGIQGDAFPDPLGLSNVLPEPQFDTLKACQDLVDTDLHNAETAHYSQVLMEWIRSWDTETRHKIILDQALYKRDVRSELVEDIPAAVIWNYLCTRQDVRRLREWIDTQHPSQNKEVLVEPSWPFNLPIDKNMVDNITATSFTKEIILDEFARRGLFSSKEQVDFEALTARLRRIQGLFCRPHIIERSHDPTVMAVQDLHRYFIQFSIDRHLPELLYFYLDYWRLCVDSTNMDHFHLDKRIPAWVEMMLHFRKAAASILDPESVFEASLACSRCVHSLNISCIEQMVEEGLIGTALATLMYSQERMQAFLANPPEKAKQGLMSLPTLYQALFDKDMSSEVTGITTVYQILQGNIPFNPNKLFGWQSTHTNLTEDAVRELPHFSCESLAKQYGHKEHLQFSYFLKQGRPCFAFCNFVLEEGHTTGSSQISSKSIENVCVRVHWLGLKYFTRPHVTAACAVFMEMIGRDSTVFRVHVQAANQIAAYKMKGKGPQGITLEEKKQYEQKVKEQIVSQFHQCLRSPDSQSAGVLTDLEETIHWSIQRSHLPRLSFEAEQKWLLVLTFCKCHSLQYSNMYLEWCAQENDWLKFLTHAQCYQYPPKQVQTAISHFTDSITREHMSFIVNNICQAEIKELAQSPKIQFKKDFRARLYARVGVAKKDAKNDQSSSDDEEKGPESQDQNEEPETKESHQHTGEVAAVEVHSDNVFDLLLACQKTAHPSHSLCTLCITHRNPVLAVLAACFQERNLLDCLCCWLFAALSHKSTTPLTRVNTHSSEGDQGTACSESPTSEPQIKTSWSLNELLEMILSSLKTSNMATVYDGFYIFFPDAGILPFLKFIAQFHQQESIQTIKVHLNQFSLWLLKMQSDHTVLDCRLFPMVWVEEMVLSVAKYLICEMSLEQAGKALQLLDECHVMDRISGAAVVPDISLLNKLYVVIRNTGVRLNLRNLMDSKDPGFQAEWRHVIASLQDKQHWKEARVASELLGFPTKDITLSQLHTSIHELEGESVWQYDEVQREFWRDAESLLHRHETDIFLAAEFFQEQGDRSRKSSVREYLYQLAYKWLSKAEVNTEHSKKLFTQIWRSKIQGLLERLKQENPESPPAQLTKQVSLSQADRQHLDTGQLRKLSSITPQPADTGETLTDEEEGALSLILQEMLDKGSVLEAQKIASHFGFPSTDLNIILTCHKLASGKLAPDSLDVSMRRLVSSEGGPTSATRRRKSSVQMVSLPRTGSSLSIASRLSDLSGCVTEEDSVLSCIQLLSRHCTHGKQCCEVVQAAYNIAKVLDIEYMETLAVNEFNLLNHILKCDLPDRYLLAKAYTQAVAIPDDQVAGFLCNIVVETLKVQLGIIPGADNRPSLASLRSGISSTSLLKGGQLISEIVQLCENPAVLGQCLLNQVLSTTSSEVNPTLATLSMEVELLIYGHDCFTLACHMEGISDVLRTCKTVAVVLGQAEEFTLMVRLLTGVGRYSEMVYVFDILKQQHQFELLFRKGTDKESKLKLAILDYLQRYHPEDVETYTMAALHFTMYREISQMQEKAAHKLLTGLTASNPLENTSENQDILHKALHSLSDAAENYVKVNCLRHAEDCVKKAKLVALQLQLLISRTRVVNLDTEALRVFTRTHRKVHEVYIVLEAYNQQALWSEAVYSHVVKQGDFKYLTELAPYLTLTANIVTDIAERFRNDGHQNKQTSGNLHKVLVQCSDVKTALQLAKSMDLKETVKELLKGPDGAYLKDSFQL